LSLLSNDPLLFSPLPTLPFQDSHAPRAPHSFPTRRSSDLSVTWAGEPVGGIRVSAVSHIEKSMTFPLAVSRGKRQRVTIEVIEQQPQTDWQALIQQAGNDQDALRDLWHQAQQQDAPQHVFDAIQQAAQQQPQGEQA